MVYGSILNFGQRDSDLRAMARVQKQLILAGLEKPQESSSKVLPLMPLRELGYVENLELHEHGCAIRQSKAPPELWR